MKKLVLCVAISSMLAACGSTGNSANSYQQRADYERERQQANVEATIKRAPDWFIKRPKNSSDIVFGVGYGESTNMMMALDMAESEAYRQLCTGAGGLVDSQSKVFRSDKDGQGTSLSTTAIRTRCPSVDITGAEVAQSDVRSNGNRYSYYVLVALPLGDANTRARTKEAMKQINEAAGQSEREFRELDNVKSKTEITPVPAQKSQEVSVVRPDGTTSVLNLMPVDNAEYKARRAEAIQKPGAVVGQVSINN